MERSPSLSVAGGHAPASAAWVIVSQPNGTTTKIWPVTVGGQKLFAFQRERPESAELDGLRQLRARGQVAGLLTPGSGGRNRLDGRARATVPVRLGC